MRFGQRNIALGAEYPCAVIAEIGVNHNNDMDIARRMIDAALGAGADIIKFQAFCTEKEISRFASMAEYQKKSESEANSQFELCKALELSHANLRMLFQYCEQRGAATLCAAFDESSLDFLLRDMKMECIKIPSSEVTNLPFLRRIGAAGVDVVLSTGASTLAETALAVEHLRAAGCGELMVFHCVSEYPAPPDEVNLRVMHTLRQALNCPVGFSDHTEGTVVSTVAAALGACALEKHFTLNKALPGPDHRASIEPHELAELVRAVRVARLCLGDGRKKPGASELKNRTLIRKGLVATADLPTGTILTSKMLTAKRPATGLDPELAEHLVGLRLCKNVAEDAPIVWELFRP